MYKVGDKVMLRDDLVIGSIYRTPSCSLQFLSEMNYVLGEICTVTEVNPQNDNFKIDNCYLNLWYNPSMFNPVVQNIEELDDLVINKGYKPTNVIINNVLRGEKIV